MPTYKYLCPNCHEAFEQQAGWNDRFIVCACGSEAERRPFSSIPNLKGETVARSIPDVDHRFDAEKREFQASWGGNDRTLDMLHRHRSVDQTNGWTMVDTKGMNHESRTDVS